MPPRKSITLTEAELRLMKLLWAGGESSIADLVQALAGDTPLAYNSVLTTIRVLERKGYVDHRQDPDTAGRAFLYIHCVPEHEASRSEVRHVLHRFFGNSRERLLLALLGDGDITPQELQTLKSALAQAPPDSASAPNPDPTSPASAEHAR